MTIRSLLLTLLAGALVALIGRTYLRLPLDDQERLKRPILAVGAGVVVLGIAIMLMSLMP